MKIVNYLDVTFNLNDRTYKPLHKTKQRIQIYTQRLKLSTKCHPANPTILKIKVIHPIFQRKNISRSSYSG